MWHFSAVPLEWAINPNFRLSADGLWFLAGKSCILIVHIFLHCQQSFTYPSPFHFYFPSSIFLFPPPQFHNCNIFPPPPLPPPHFYCFLLLLLLFHSSYCFSTTQARPTPKRPNILCRENNRRSENNRRRRRRRRENIKTVKLWRWD